MNSSTSESYTIEEWPNAAAVILMTLNSFMGFYFNILMIIEFITEKKQKTSFNLICVFRAINNATIIFIAMTIVYIPATILGYSVYPKLVETVLLTTALNLKIYNQIQGIYLSVNRLFAIYFPLKYNLFFGLKLTAAFHIVYYLDRVRNLTFENIDRYNTSFFLLYSVKHLAYGGITQTPDGMFYWALILAGIPSFLNALTFIRFYYLKNRMSQNTERMKNAKKNMTQFFQNVIQDSLFSISVIFTMKMNTLIDHRFYTFFSQTFLWQSTHVIDGLIMYMFNKKIRESRVSPTEVSVKQTTAVGAAVQLSTVTN